MTHNVLKAGFVFMFLAIGVSCGVSPGREFPELGQDIAHPQLVAGPEGALLLL